MIALPEGAVVGEGVVVEEEARGDVEGDEDVDRVVLVAGQDKEDTEQVDDPRRRVKYVELAWGI